MKQVVLNIPDNKYQFFMELVKSLGFVKILNETKLSRKQSAFIKGTKESLDHVEEHIKGNIDLKSADQLLDEL